MTVCIQNFICFGGKNVSHATYACMHRVHMYKYPTKPNCGGVTQQPPSTKKKVYRLRAILFIFPATL